MLVTTKEMFENAYKWNYAIWGFNVNNMEIVQWIMEAASIKKSAVILQVSAWARKYADPIYLKYLIQASIEKYPEVPVAMHLDHWSTFEMCKECIDWGFSSIMIDGSHYDFEKNIEITKQVVEYAHSKWVVVEAELWTLEWVEDDVVVEEWKGSYTNPNQALEFVERTWIDSLAIAIWTSHWAYKFKSDAKPKLDFERLNKITKILEWFPLVLHWASTVIPEFVDMCNDFWWKIPWTKWVPEDMIWEAVKTWVCKVNIDTDIRLAITWVIRKALTENPWEFDPRKYFWPARDVVQKMVERKMDILGSKWSF